MPDASAVHPPLSVSFHYHQPASFADNSRPAWRIATGGEHSSSPPPPSLPPMPAYVLPEPRKSRCIQCISAAFGERVRNRRGKHHLDHLIFLYTATSRARFPLSPTF
ncbi:hypothetical protein LY78DRAFT_295239 [Colletotrichum sublineola]|nr:hypothetical protein LY78DRAFT_295239 [Colletotrichum sublineola]